MQCTSYIPVYHERDHSVGSSGVMWHLFNGYTNYGEENGYNNVPLQPFNMDHDKNVLRQIIQNHDATFRHQVHELHRLYQKQRELMDQMRAKNVLQESLPSQKTSESNHSLSHATSAADDGIFIRKGSYSDIKFPFPSFESNRNGNTTFFDIDRTAGACHDDDDDKRIRFGERNLFRATEIRSEIHNNNPRILDEKKYLFIDLNQPLDDDSGFHNSNSSSDGRNSPVMIIDLNSLPVGGFIPETVSSDHVSNVKKGTSDEIMEKLDFDLNSEFAPTEPSSDRTVQGPVSPENQETLPPRGKCIMSEDHQTQLKGTSSVLSNQENGEQLITELDKNAANILVSISSGGTHNCLLSWFAKIVVFENAKKEKEIASLSFGSRKEHHSGGKSSAPEWKKVGEGFLETGSSSRRKKKAGKKASSKSRRCSSDRFKKSMSSILKQHLGSWGKIKKRERGLRRKASKFVCY
ncbi:Plant protein of unknown function (DUF863 [Striga hermonthica]|uniref:Uncharacterized protein n=1 Tax=Striga hermonthica TaxID=68872 RepID=A0A9N7ND96_STRHE|nr:Plant protein of unknown function (DUF863 [Striga hermonthica]